MIELYQFPFSHYCEKARWALEYKRVAYKPVNLLPGLHVKAVRRRAPKSCLPVLVDGKIAVQESSAIITYLDGRYPDPALTPGDPTEAREALEWERYLNEEIGVTLRLWFYYHALPDRDLALRVMLDGAAWYARPLYWLSYPKVRSAMTRSMNINDDSAEQSKHRMLLALGKLDDALNERQFLVGDRFSRADLTACALLSTFCLPNDIEASGQFPPAIRAQRDQLKGRRFFRWVRDVYDNYRQPMPIAPAPIFLDTNLG
ncbi:MAG: glutathione S-transferase family protein [Burkholderiales bacterium]